MAVEPIPRTSEPGVQVLAGGGHPPAPSAGACPLNLDVDALRRAVRDEYAEVAANPSKGFHFHTGRPLAALLGYDPRDVDPLPEAAVESFAGVGNPWVWGRPRPGETVVEVGSGAGLDALIGARQVDPDGAAAGAPARLADFPPHRGRRPPGGQQEQRLLCCYAL